MPFKISKLFFPVLLLLACYTVSAQDTSYAMTRPGWYTGLQFGFLDTHYSDILNRYSAGGGNNSAQGSSFGFRGLVGYDVNSLWGMELGLMQYTDNSSSNTTSLTGGNTIRSASLDLFIINALATIHLPLNDSRSWVGTPKFGFALERATLKYKYFNSDGKSPSWGGGNVDNALTQTFVTPTAGVSFDHSYNKHLALSFGYEYYFGGYGNYNDPLKTPISSIHYFSIGGIYKF